MSSKPSISTAQTPVKQSPTANTKPNRLPAPTLFVGPPSRNASQLSVSRGDNPITRHRSTLSRSTTAGTDVGASSVDSTYGSPTQQHNTHPTLKKPSDKATEAKWREMRSALDEISLTAQTSTHVFGPQHAAALDELRLAQIELARAWGRGNEDKDGTGEDASETGAQSNVGEKSGDLSSNPQATEPGHSRARGNTVSSASTALSDESMFSDDSRTGRPSGVSRRLEEETAQDIRLAGERRAENEAYFVKVDRGVRDVVAKLEVVAQAMRGVESESRSLWSMSQRSSTETREDGKAG
ncbi:Hypothetical protein R9X50_00003400 [Acrodontium crateriforme]|uniref:Uncharacterized protein n=1 Tax=Acrodontium crateriforme TaxID=150365 RepID=A0AAQ3LZM5_9PEZI|nr:Hypothetical protein R9X50_00003400 [Acrodontium crateriforme]